jgi:2-polyprenyl-6-methoxyphenol hydroxylase-like FAD-dependent oxidoreductase
MPSWHTGHVVLVSNAAACASQLSGRGTSLAITGTWLLAQALSDHPGDLEAALVQYEREQRPHVTYAQGTCGTRW